MSELRIDIHGRNDHNTISEKEYPKFENISFRLKAEGGILASQNVRIIFEPPAAKLLFDNIAWGARYRRGDVEKAGILIGNYYRDCTSCEEVVWADVVVVVPANSALVNATFETIDITAEAWKGMYETADEFRSENLQIVGWYHTHLDSINTRFSGIDRVTQRKAFTYEYSFGVVFNPNQRKWSVFYGPESRECVGELLFDEELLNCYGSPQITIKQVNGDSVLQADGSVVHFDNEGHPIENAPAVQRVSEVVKNNTRSIGQCVGQVVDRVVSGITQLGGRNKRCEERSSDMEQPKRADTPKIKIINSVPIIPVVQCQFISKQMGNRSVTHSDINCTFNNYFFDQIIRYNQCDTNSSSKDTLIWGCVQQNGMNIVISHVASENDANARILILRNNEDKLVMTGLENLKKHNKRYSVLIKYTDCQAIDILVVQYNRENI